MTKKFDPKELKYIYTLEHILPQKWEEKWSIDVVPVLDAEGNVLQNPEARNIRNEAVKKLGNMTLLGGKLNTSISNNTFKEKIDGTKKTDGTIKYKGIRYYNELTIAKEIIPEGSNPDYIWNEKKIRDRTDKLCEEIKDTWSISVE